MRPFEVGQIISAHADESAFSHSRPSWHNKISNRHILLEVVKRLKNINPFDPADEEATRLFADQASQFREALVSDNRSRTLVSLFDYLIERSSDPRAPKEIEIAMAVFGKRADFDTSQDSTVRAHVHRLRRRLESFNNGKSGVLLQIPRGEYRLLLTERAESADTGVALLEKPRKPTTPRRIWTAITICFAATAILWGGLFYASSDQRPAPSPLRQTSFWQPIAAHERLPLIAAGDFYMVAESGSDGKIQRLSMRPAIRSGRDLDKYLRMHPDQYSKLRDRDIHRLPTTVAMGAAAILPVVASVRPDHGMADIIPVSQISQETIDANNIIYIDRFSELGMLRSPVLGQSRFAPGPDPNELRDMPSGTSFRVRPASDNQLNGDDPVVDPYGYDYGYIASYPGPSGNQIIVIAGMEDAALAQMVKLISDKRQLDMLSREIGDAKAFEALYQVRTSGGLIFDTHLLIARSLKVGKGRVFS